VSGLEDEFWAVLGQPDRVRDPQPAESSGHRSPGLDRPVPQALDQPAACELPDPGVTISDGRIPDELNFAARPSPDRDAISVELTPLTVG
jgi:hypothetical protein